MTTPTFTPTLRQLRAFLAVYRLGKLSAAANQLFITQSAVSMLLKQLEEGLQQRLFDRTTRALAPTQAGKDAAVMAERILRDVNAMGTAFSHLNGLRTGRVTLAITPTLAGMLLPQALGSFVQTYPGVKVVIDDCAPEQFSSRVLNEHADFGIGTPENAGGELSLQTLMRDRLCVVCQPSHPLASLRRVRWQDLEDFGVIAGRPGYGARPLVDAASAKAGIQLRVEHEMSFLSKGIWMAASGIAPAIMPSAYVSYAPESVKRGLVVRPLSAPSVSRDVSIVTKTGRSVSRACEIFIETLRRTLREHPPVGPSYSSIA